MIFKVVAVPDLNEVRLYMPDEHYYTMTPDQVDKLQTELYEVLWGEEGMLSN